MKKGQIFVFGSNRAGVHGAGAAKTAMESYGAIFGIGEGLRGSSYGIPTKDDDIQTLPLDEIKIHVDTFLQFAREHPTLSFFVTRIGCGLAGYTNQDIAPMFVDAPRNCELDPEWVAYIASRTVRRKPTKTGG